MEKDAYLTELARYIVLNPVRARMVRSAYEWPWSSYRGTAGLIEAPPFLTTDWILGGIGDDRQSAQTAYRQFVSEGKGQPSPFSDLTKKNISGDPGFFTGEIRENI